MVSSVIIRSNLHVEIFDMKVRKRALLTLTLLSNLPVNYQGDRMKGRTRV